MSNETDINLNQSKCMKDASGFTGTTVTNVCSGETRFVPYGALDVTFGIVGGLVAVSVLLALANILRKICSDDNPCN